MKPRRFSTVHCVAAAKIYLATALDLCSRKAP